MEPTIIIMADVMCMLQFELNFNKVYKSVDGTVI